MPPRVALAFAAWLLCTAACPSNDTVLVNANGAIGPPGRSSFNPNFAQVSTSSTNDLIVAVVVGYQDGNYASPTPPQVVSVSGGGLTWTRRGGRYQMNPTTTCTGLFAPCYTDVEIWTAPAAATLNNVNVDATFNEDVIMGVLVVGAFSGVLNLAAPWDTNLSLPGSANNPSGAASTPQVTNLSTTEANDLLLTVCADFLAGAAPNICFSPAGTAWPFITGGQFTAAFTGRRVNVGLFAQSVSSAQSGITFQSTGGSEQSWQAVADALTCSPTPPTVNIVTPQIEVNE